jgi:2-polyprenyl-6-hydroxyphenyl methylase/3-demethylubiquinone-9 3-methyltransferase
MKIADEAKKLKWQLAQTAERKWWKRYLKSKDPHAYLDWKKSYWENLLSHTGLDFDQFSGERVLDVGCGPAGIFIHLKAFQIDAVDPLLDYYNTHLEPFSYEFYPYVRFTSQPFEAFIPPQKYKLIFCLNAINHFISLEKSAFKMINALADNGYLIISNDTHNYKLIKLLFRLFPGDILHPHQMDQSDCCTLFMSQPGAKMNLVRSHLIKTGTLFDHRLIVFQKTAI